MKLIVGLGNPGFIYAGSRHNIGFSVVRGLGKIHRIAFAKERGIPAQTGRGVIEGEKVLCALPLTFMNVSGVAVKALVQKYKVALDDLLVVCDDLDLKFGRIRVKASGSSAGHRGVGSIIEALESERFARVRIGIGRPTVKEGTSDFVLGRFTREERDSLGAVQEKALECCLLWAAQGIAHCMNKGNRREC